jgi:hypothetical protein
MRASLKTLHSGSAEQIALAHHIEQLLDSFDFDALRQLLATTGATYAE